jgi:hypothetical protein
MGFLGQPGAKPRTMNSLDVVAPKPANETNTMIRKQIANVISSERRG